MFSEGNVLTVYLDDSGTHGGAEVTVVAGFVSTKLRWDSFRREWARALRRERIEIFRMSDLENRQGEFEGWSKERTETFRGKLFDIIRQLTLAPIGSALINDDWERVMPAHIRSGWGGSYGWCAEDCAHQIYKWAKRTGTSGKIKFIFEKGTVGHGQVSKVFAEYATDPKWAALQIGGHSFEEKKLVPLQAADLLAYETYKHMCNRGKRPMRRSLALLMNEQDTRHLQFHNTERLMKLVNAASELDKQGKLG
jgi:hypothetical protein